MKQRKQFQLEGDGEVLGPDGRIWTAYMVQAEELGVDPGTIANNMPPDAKTLEGYNRLGSPMALRLRDDMYTAVSHLTGKDPFNVLEFPDRIFVAKKSGRRYATVSVAAGLLGVSETPVKAASVHKLTGRAQNGIATLYCIDDLEKDQTINAIRESELRVDDKGFCDNGSRATIDGFWDSLPEDHFARKNGSITAFRRQAERLCSAKPAVDRAGRPNAQTFLVKDLEEKALSIFKETRRVDKKTGIYEEKNEGGSVIMRWTTKQTWMKIYEVTKFALNKGMEEAYGNWENVPRVKGISQREAYDWLYSEETIRQILHYILDAKVQIKKGIYEIRNDTSDQVEKAFRSSQALAREVGISAANVRLRLDKNSCPKVEGIDRNSGAEETVYDYAFFRQVFRDQLGVVLNINENGQVCDKH